MYKYFIIIALLLVTGGVFAQSGKQDIDLEDAIWKRVNVSPEFTEYKGQNAITLAEGEGERQIYLEDYKFENGIIEFDIAAVPYYAGITFRVRDDYVYESIYFRPQNSVNDDPVNRSHTVQYIASPAHTWYYFREKSPEKYESYANLKPQEWFHVKIVVKGKKAEIYVNDEVQPCLVIDELVYGYSKGSVGFWAGNHSPGTFANLTITHLPGSDLKEGEILLEKAVYTEEQQYLFNIIKTRRSVRNFKPDPVPQEHIMKILEMAAASPTSGNQQPWKFLVIQDREKLDILREKCLERKMRIVRERGITDENELLKIRQNSEKYYRNYLSAPVYVVVLVDSASKYPSYNIYDGANAATALMIAARALGYGTVYSQDSIPYELIKEVFGIPNQYERICFTPIGVPVEWPEPHNKKPLYELTAFEKMINGVNYKQWIKKVEVELSQELLKEYIGEFRLDEKMTFDVIVEGSEIFIEVTGQPRIQIFAEAKDKFFLKMTPAELHFVRDDSGLVNAMKFYQGSEVYNLTKIQ